MPGMLAVSTLGEHFQESDGIFHLLIHCEVLDDSFSFTIKRDHHSFLVFRNVTDHFRCVGFKIADGFYRLTEFHDASLVKAHNDLNIA